MQQYLLEFVSKHEQPTRSIFWIYDCKVFFYLGVLPQRAEISTQCTLKAFLSPQRANVTRWLPELFASTVRDFDSSIKFNASTCEEYYEWFPSCGTEVAFVFEIKQVCFKFSCVISRDQQAAVGSLLRIEAFLSNNSLLRKIWSPWNIKAKTWSISWHLHSRINKTLLI